MTASGETQQEDGGAAMSSDDTASVSGAAVATMASATDLAKPAKSAESTALTVHPSSLSLPSSGGAAAKVPCPQVDYLYSWRIFSHLYMGWLTPLLSLGAQRPLQFEDLYDTWPSEKCNVCYAQFEPLWQQERAKAAQKKREPKLINVFYSMVGWEFLLAAVLFGYTVFNQLIGPQILKQLTSYSEAVLTPGSSVTPLDGYKWCLYLFPARP